MLGALEAGIFNTGSVMLNPGDMLIAYSDGVTECRNAEDEEFDMQRLLNAAGTAMGTTRIWHFFRLWARCWILRIRVLPEMT